MENAGREKKVKGRWVAGHRCNISELGSKEE
jgi:hypothetical protein